MSRIETWGLVAAALGNAKNRFNFQQTFWWHDNGFRIYLKAAKENSVVIEVKDPETGRVLASAPAAMAAWTKARTHFLALKNNIEGCARKVARPVRVSWGFSFGSQMAGRNATAMASSSMDKTAGRWALPANVRAALAH